MIKDKYSVTIFHRRDIPGKIIYDIKVTGECGAKCSVKRYSDLNEFHNQIQKNIGLLKLQINPPEFPGRKLFGSTNKSEEGIELRSKQLQVYFNELLGIDKLLNLPMVQEYIPQKSALPTQKGKDGFKQTIHVSIERYQVFDEVVVYYLRFREKFVTEEWTYKLRYSELKQIHTALQESKLKTKLPIFPQKKTFGSTNEDPESIESRREQLENYLNELLSNEELFQNQVVQFIISDSKQDFEKSQIIDNMKKNKQSKQVRYHVNNQVRGDLNQIVSGSSDEHQKTQNIEQEKIQTTDTILDQQFIQQ